MGELALSDKNTPSSLDGEKGVFRFALSGA